VTALLPDPNAALLWTGVLALGALHGLNPAMGWPLAVARGLERRQVIAVVGLWGPLGAGHLAAMAVVLVPFTMLAWLATWGPTLRLLAGAGVLVFGLSRWVARGHPAWLSRVRPSQVAMWSFLMATAHGAALMLVPVLMGLCAAPAGSSAPAFGHAAEMGLMARGLDVAVAVCIVHTLAMLATGAGCAVLVYRWLGLEALRRAWLDLEKAWALALVVSGIAAIAAAWPAASAA
jgi:hypothetical protein